MSEAQLLLHNFFLQLELSEESFFRQGLQRRHYRDSRDISINMKASVPRNHDRAVIFRPYADHPIVDIMPKLNQRSSSRRWKIGLECLGNVSRLVILRNLVNRFVSLGAWLWCSDQAENYVFGVGCELSYCCRLGYACCSFKLPLNWKEILSFVKEFKRKCFKTKSKRRSFLKRN